MGKSHFLTSFSNHIHYFPSSADYEWLLSELVVQLSYDDLEVALQALSVLEEAAQVQMRALGYSRKKHSQKT